MTTASLNALRSKRAPERRLGALALADDLAVADLVAAGLAGPAAIAVDFARDFLGLRAVVVDEEADALLAGPALGVEAGVDDQAARAEGDALEIAEAARREVVIDAKLVGQLLGIERPAFGIGVERQQGADQRQLVGIFALPDVARDRLVVGEVGQVELACAGRWCAG